MLRKKVLPARLRPAQEAFEVQAQRVADARRALLSCLPVGRVDPAPVPVGLDVLAEELTAVAAEMERWRVPDVDTAWTACQAAISEALAAVPTARAVAETSDELEELLGAVEAVVEPLGHAWGPAERRWRALRVRG